MRQLLPAFLLLMFASASHAAISSCELLQRSRLSPKVNATQGYSGTFNFDFAKQTYDLSSWTPGAPAFSGSIEKLQCEGNNFEFTISGVSGYFSATTFHGQIQYQPGGDIECISFPSDGFPSIICMPRAAKHTYSIAPAGEFLEIAPVTLKSYN